MRKEKQKKFYIGVGLAAAFVLWTVLVCFVDKRAIGPQESNVGFGTLNRFFHTLTGVHMSLYTITDWLGIVPLGFIMGFAFLGLTQWIRRKKLSKVDNSLLALGGFYIATMAVYVLFEVFVVNYRPVLINGYLEASYPSSTTMLVLCVMPTAIMQLKTRIYNSRLKKIVCFVLVGFTAFMVIGRLLSGVHWLTDIIGGAILSAGLVMLYDSVCQD